MGMQYGMTCGTGSSSSGSTYAGASSATYRNLARRWDDKAAACSATISSLTASLDYENGQMVKLQAVKAKLNDAARLQMAVEDDVSKLGADLAAATEIAGARERANSLGGNTTLQIGDAQAACQELIDKLQGELDTLTGDLASARKSYDDAIAKAKSYRHSAANAAALEKRYTCMDSASGRL
ncbi:MAG: hypothetical protein E7001_00120 [Coriobacteriaceae bacterium]|nr:hypothetical protein [Coriobacteriaceae bacterium]